MASYVAYYRVSTQRQGRSGLGLEAQQKAVREYVAGVGGSIVAELVEVESGKQASNRPELQKALVIAKKRRDPAILIVAKLDRLARQASFVTALMDTPGLEFVAVDFPQANRLVLQIVSAVAEYEAQQISIRTKAALAARRHRGLPLGNPDNLLIGGSPASEHNAQQAREEAERLRPVIEAIQRSGIATVRGIAEELNRRGYKTARGTTYHATTIARMLSRLAA